MIKSMTGYGNCRTTVEGRDINIEIKSVNHRYLDFYPRFPRMLSFLEDPVKTVISKSISRGKVEVYLSVDSSMADNQIQIQINEPFLKDYVKALRSIRDELSLTDDISVANVAKNPDVFNIKKPEIDNEKLTNEVISVLERALSEFDSMRSREGEKLYNDISGNLDEIERIVFEIEKKSPQTVMEYRDKLWAKISELTTGIEPDAQRLATEVAIFADKVAVDEETVRLKSHISQYRQFMKSGQPIGKKLDFLTQELNREVNTIGSKCNDLEISMMVVELKSCVEKIREQIQNIE